MKPAHRQVFRIQEARAEIGCTAAIDDNRMDDVAPLAQGKTPGDTTIDDGLPVILK